MAVYLLAKKSPIHTIMPMVKYQHHEYHYVYIIGIPFVYITDTRPSYTVHMHIRYSAICIDIIHNMYITVKGVDKQSRV